MGLSYVVNQLHDKHSLADACSSKQSNFTSSCVGSEQIDDLNPCD